MFMNFNFQLYGRLPFDDSNHKKLLKQVQNRVSFPSKPEVSEGCRIIILKMLTRLQDRIPLGNFRYDPWFKKFVLSENSQKDLCHESPGMAELVIKQPLPTITSGGPGSARPDNESSDEQNKEQSRVIEPKFMM